MFVEEEVAWRIGIFSGKDEATDALAVEEVRRFLEDGLGCSKDSGFTGCNEMRVDHVSDLVGKDAEGWTRDVEGDGGYWAEREKDVIRTVGCFDEFRSGLLRRGGRGIVL